MAGSLWAARLVEALLFQLEPRDPMTFGGAAAVLVAVGVLAAWLPAHRPPGSIRWRCCAKGRARESCTEAPQIAARLGRGAGAGVWIIEAQPSVAP